MTRTLEEQLARRPIDEARVEELASQMRSQVWADSVLSNSKWPEPLPTLSCGRSKIERTQL